MNVMLLLLLACVLAGLVLRQERQERVQASAAVQLQHL